jgi:hypothetical protein
MTDITSPFTLFRKIFVTLARFLARELSAAIADILKMGK